MLLDLNQTMVLASLSVVLLAAARPVHRPSPPQGAPPLPAVVLRALAPLTA